MSLINDIVKIQLSREGYLPDWPPHLISNAEMCAAVLYTASTTPDVVRPSKLLDMYPMPTGDGITPDIVEAYNELIEGIRVALVKFQSEDDTDAELPNWVYSYMLGVVIGPNNDIVDRHNALVTIGEDNVYDELTPRVYAKCLATSKRWLSKYGLFDRPPTIFIEPHILKYFRLLNSI